MKNEYGRSMIEMLGVLAIIGVLSIGGLAGYTMAMNRHRANQILDYVSRCAVAAQTKGDGYNIGLITGTTYETSGRKVNTYGDDTCTNLLQLEEIPNGLGTFTVCKATSSDLSFTIASPDIKSKDIVQALLDRDNTNVTIARDGNANASGGGKVKFIFRK